MVISPRIDSLQDAVDVYEAHFPKLTEEERGSFIDGFHEGWNARERLEQERNT